MADQTNIEQYGTFVVSLKDVYEQHGRAIGDLTEQVRGVDSKLDTLIALENARGTETRLRSLERWRYAIPPALFTSIAAALAATIR